LQAAGNLNIRIDKNNSSTEADYQNDNNIINLITEEVFQKE